MESKEVESTDPLAPIGRAEADAGSSVMSVESGILPAHLQAPLETDTRVDTGISTQQPQDSTFMNEPKDLSRPASGMLTSDDEDQTSTRLKGDTRGPCSAADSISNKPASRDSSSFLPGNDPIVKAASSSAVSTVTTDSSARGRTPSDGTAPHVATTSASEGSSASSLEVSSSRPGSSAQLVDKAGPSTSEPARTAQHPASVQVSPLKATTMLHLHKKYTAELEYMLREFRKLERQLLGAKGNAAGIEENAGSRERREKLHSFIMHLEDTLRQIELGCRLEAEGKSTVMVGVTVGDSATTTTTPEEDVTQTPAGALTGEKEEEENVQKLEEHILANLLPVKVRLKKQLAAQQGASRNPVGMPVARRGMLQQPVAEGTATFAAAAEQRRKQAEAAASNDETQFGKPLVGGASSLTQKLHGQTLGSSDRKYGYGVGSSSDPSKLEAAASLPDDKDDSSKKRKILYAGMAPGSTQLQSGVSAASGVHKMIIETPGLYAASAKAPGNGKVPEAAQSASFQAGAPKPTPQHLKALAAATAPPQRMPHPGQKVRGAVLPKPAPPPVAGAKRPMQYDDTAMTEEERNQRKLRKRKKARKEAKLRERERHLQILLQKQTIPPPKTAGKKSGKAAAGKGQGKKKGPRTVEYLCALCSEAYSSTCDCNPWWALTSHDCPKCRKTQVPRVDISSPANAIEYHPALLAHAEENATGSGGGVAPGPATHPGGMSVMHINPSHIPSSATFPMSNKMPNRRYPTLASDSDSDSDLSDISDGDLSEGTFDSDDSDFDIMGALSPAGQAENEQFGKEYTGPTLTDDQTSRLLIMMAHASTCPGRHKNAKHRDVCNNVKFLMLHVRDCPGTTATFDVCPFPWCRKVKHSLYHLVSCIRPKTCAICSPKGLSPNLSALVGLNNHRRMKQRERRAAAVAAAAAAARGKAPTMARPMKPGVGPPVSSKYAYKPAPPKLAPPKPGPASTLARKGVTPMAKPTIPPYPASRKLPSIEIASQQPVAVPKGAVTSNIPGGKKPAAVPQVKPASTPAAVAQESTTSRLAGTASTFPHTDGTPAEPLITTKPAVSSMSGAVGQGPTVPATSPEEVATGALKPPVANKADAETVAKEGVTAAAVAVSDKEGAVVPPCEAVTVIETDSMHEKCTGGTVEACEPSVLVDDKKISSGAENKVVVPQAVALPSMQEGANSPLIESSALSSSKASRSSSAIAAQSKEINAESSLDMAVATPAAALIQESSSGSLPKKDDSGNEHSHENCADECCNENAKGDLQEDSGDGHSIDLAERKSQGTPPPKSPDSPEISSSCSDEVKKKPEIVRISSC